MLIIYFVSINDVQVEISVNLQDRKMSKSSKIRRRVRKQMIKMATRE